MTDEPDLRARVESIIADLQANARDWRRRGLDKPAQEQEMTALRLTEAIQASK